MAKYEVKYRGKHFYHKKFSEVGILHARQLNNINGNYKNNTTTRRRSFTCQPTTLVSLDISSYYQLYLTKGSCMRCIVVRWSKCLQICLIHLNSVKVIQIQLIPVY